MGKSLMCTSFCHVCFEQPRNLSRVFAGLHSEFLDVNFNVIGDQWMADFPSLCSMVLAGLVDYFACCFICRTLMRSWSENWFS